MNVIVAERHTKQAIIPYVNIVGIYIQEIVAVAQLPSRCMRNERLLEGDMMAWRIWENNERQDLIVGEVIRQKVDKKNANNPPADWDGYIYGRVVDGFGCHKMCNGRAIFVENESWTYDGCLNRTSQDKARWERSRKIQILVN